MLKSIENLRDFRAASGHFEVIVDVEQDARFVPSKIKGERVLFVAIGSVDAGVDFSGLEDGAVDVSDDAQPSRSSCRRPPSASPSSTSSAPTSTTATAARSTGSSRCSATTPGVQRELYPLAEEKLANAARDGSGLLARAERNTRLMLEGPAPRSLGFTRVDVRFAEV